MGKRRFAGTVKGHDNVTDVSTYSNHGITAHIRGWDEGVRVVGGVEDGRDVFHIYGTSGSNGSRNEDQLLGTFRRDDAGFHWIPTRGEHVRP